MFYIVIYAETVHKYISSDGDEVEVKRVESNNPNHLGLLDTYMGDSSASRTLRKILSQASLNPAMTAALHATSSSIPRSIWPFSAALAGWAEYFSTSSPFQSVLKVFFADDVEDGFVEDGDKAVVKQLWQKHAQVSYSFPYMWL